MYWNIEKEGHSGLFRVCTSCTGFHQNLPNGGSYAAVEHLLLLAQARRGARICLRLEGAAAGDVLAHQVALDLDLTQFPAGRFAQTGFHHAGVLLDRRGQERFELYVLSTFAASTWDVLVDTALPYGFEVGVESAAAGWSDSRIAQ